MSAWIDENEVSVEFAMALTGLVLAVRAWKAAECACSRAAVMTGPTAFLASVRPWRV
jgi:hypothetical protein